MVDLRDPTNSNLYTYKVYLYKSVNIVISNEIDICCLNLISLSVISFVLDISYNHGKKKRGKSWYSFVNVVGISLNQI